MSCPSRKILERKKEKKVVGEKERGRERERERERGKAVTITFASFDMIGILNVSLNRNAS